MATIARDRFLPRRRPAPGRDWPGRLTDWAIWLLVLGSLVSEILGQGEIASFGFYTFHAIDPAVPAVAIACAAHLSRRRLAWHVFTLPILVIASLISINFVRGVAVDPAAALIWVRGNGAIGFTLLLAVTMPPSAAAGRTVRRALICYSVMASLLLLLREATHPTLFMTVDVSDLDANDGGRSLSAGGTLPMVVTSGILLAELLQRARFRLDWRAAFALLLPLFVALTRQGTANICEIATILVILAFQRGPSRNAQFVLVTGLLLAVPLILAALVPALQGNDFLLRRTSNYDTRKAVWDALMSVFPSQSLLDQTIGFPAGQRPPLYVLSSQGFRLWDASIHSMYYGSLPMMGYLGAICFFLLLGSIAIVALADLFLARRSASAIPLAFVIATAIFSNSYEVRGAELLGLLYAICLIRAAREGVPMPAGSARRSARPCGGGLRPPAYQRTARPNPAATIAAG